MARRLTDESLGGRPVLLAYPPGLDLVAALFGCFHAGAIAVVTPPPTAATLDRLRLLAAESEAAAILTAPALVDRLRAEALGDARVLAADAAADPGDFVPVAPDPAALAMLQYTSGSTASPRGVMLTHANLLANLAVLARATGVREGEVGVSWLPYHHDMGLFGCVIFPVHAGFACVHMPPVAFLMRPSRWLDAMSRYRAVLTAGPCFAYELCQRRITPEQRASLDLSSWRVGICGAETVRADVLARFAETFAPVGLARGVLAPAYGLAETTLLAASVKPGEGFATLSVDAPALARGRAMAPRSVERARDLVPCGHPWPDQELIVVDPGSGVAAAHGDVGEIWLRGPSVSAGYWRRPDLTAATFNAVRADEAGSSGWLRTGDLGFLTQDGVTVTGRRKDMIIVRGSNFDPLDLEIAAQESHPELSPGGGGAFSIDGSAGEQVVLAQEVERSAIKTLDADAIVARVAETITRRFGLTLHDLVLLRPGTLPRTTSGKVQRHVCSERYVEDRLPRLAETRHPALGRWRPERP